MTTLLYVGPSLADADELLSDTDIEVCPPIAAGDLLRLDLGPGDTIGIVDGYFHQQRAVRHKELLMQLERGVRVLGAASMGALRAADLDTFGMEGAGRIYLDYRTGVLTADDEVAVTHGPADSGYRRASEPLVNMRATLELAEARGLVSREQRERLIDRLAATPYQLRNYRGLIEVARNLAVPRVEELRRFCRTEPVDRKREDALELVRRLSEPAAPKPDRQPDETSRTIFLYAWETAARRTESTEFVDLALLRISQLLAAGYPAAHRDSVLRRVAEECRRECDGQEAADDRAVALHHGVHRGWYGDPSATDDFGFLDLWLTPAELATLDRTEQLTLFVVRSYRIVPSIMDDLGGIEAARQAGLLGPARQLADASVMVNSGAARNDRGFSIDLLRADRLIPWICTHWKVTPAELPFALLDRGLDSEAALVTALRPYYLLVRYNPELLTLFPGTTPAVDFDLGYAVNAISERRNALFQEIFELPAEIEPNSFVTEPVLQQIRDSLQLSSGDVLADLGCGRGGPGLWLARLTSSRLHGVDSSTVAVQQATERADRAGLADQARFDVGDLTASGLDDAAAAAAICIDAFHFAADHVAAAREACRILRPGGRYVLTGWEPIDIDDDRLPAPLRVDFEAVLGRGGLAMVQRTEHSDLADRQIRLYERALADRTDDDAMRHLRAEAATGLPLSPLLRRVLVVAEKPRV
ncbi:TfuA-like protein [Kribbella sp. NPDC005582]|uniref:TfuA-like protein n=1 Tax=Kribbella sp. NPDC005582 TaxID=3156893 RepID=UPI0033BE6A7F